MEIDDESVIEVPAPSEAASEEVDATEAPISADAATADAATAASTPDAASADVAALISQQIGLQNWYRSHRVSRSPRHNPAASYQQLRTTIVNLLVQLNRFR